MSHGHIPESFIQSLIAKSDIVALIQESIKLKKSGANYSACCPFHQEKTPSFTVSALKQFYHCFGCGAHGNAIRFLMEYHSMSFVEAIERLAMRLGLAVPKDAAQIAQAKTQLNTTAVLNQVAAFYQAQLKLPLAKGAVEYLKQRGFKGSTAKQFGLGFSPPGWSNLLNHFQENDQSIKILQETGLVIKHPQGRYYDRFRNRIMFPIRSRRGEVIGFGARVFDNSQPKYLNSPESAVFHKGQCLYGVYEALQAKQKWQTALVVEGYLDVVMLSQYQVHGALATLGTAITAHHLTQLFQLVSEVIFCFDGDKAGQAAAWKALELVLPFLQQGRQVRFAFLPQGEDPDSYLRQHGEVSFAELLKMSAPLSDYFFMTLAQKVSPDTVDNRAQFAHLARLLLEQIPSGIFKEMMFEQLAQRTASSIQVVRGERADTWRWKKIKTPPPPSPLNPAYIASAILLRMPSLYELVKQKKAWWQHLNMPGMSLLNALLEKLALNACDSSESLHQALQARGFAPKRLIECVNKAALIPLEGLEAELNGALERLRAMGQEKLTEDLLKKAKVGELSLQEKTLLKEILHSRESTN